MSRLPRAVWLFGWISLATDAATEAIYPLLPFFLIQVLGAGVVSLGIVEGAAEAINSVLKILSGRAADRMRSKRRLVLAGYTLSSAVRPLIAVAQSWTHVFAVRLIDRVGKGIRGAPRDAMLAGWATPGTRGKIYGFHRGMDHAGAVIGPILASAFLYFYPGEYRTLFALTIVPGAIAVALIFFVPEGPDVGSGLSRITSSDVGFGVLTADQPPPRLGRSDGQPPRFALRRPAVALAKAGASAKAAASAKEVSRTSEKRDVVSSSKTVSQAAEVAEKMPRRFRSFMLVLALFTLGNSTDAFLLLKLTEAAGGVRFVPLMWAALHVVKASVSVIGGSWSDRVGRRMVIAVGWIVYALVYAGFAVSSSLAPLLALFLVYGSFFGFTEGTQKALVADLAPASRRGFAFGVYDAVQGFGTLAASVVFGLIWAAAGPAAAFGFGAAMALVATALLFVAVPKIST